jgi:hypothetical protein
MGSAALSLLRTPFEVIANQSHRLSMRLVIYFVKIASRKLLSKFSPKNFSHEDQGLGHFNRAGPVPRGGTPSRLPSVRTPERILFPPPVFPPPSRLPSVPPSVRLSPSLPPVLTCPLSLSPLRVMCVGCFVRPSLRGVGCFLHSLPCSLPCFPSVGCAPGLYGVLCSYAPVFHYRPLLILSIQPA